MSFVYDHYLLPILLIIGIITFSLYWFEKKYTSWVFKNWFKRKTFMSRMATGVYFVSLGLLILSTLDLRGEEKQIRSSIPDQKTLILIDNSSSMLAEDIRPSRFERAIMIARHFVQKAVGHQVSIAVFSDIQKQIVPFTDDIDLLDSRLAALKKKDISGGGSNISQALMEGLQHFTRESKDGKPRGNIFLLTDSEQHGEGLEIQIPESISLAAVGVGTRSGGPIPRRGRNNSFHGYKQHNGKKVITKLNENFLRELESKAKNYQYWVVTSYTMPTENILGFFQRVYKEKLRQGSARIRPVKMEYLVVPAIALFVFFVMMTRFRTFKSVMFVLLTLLFMTHGQRAKAQSDEKEALFPEKMEKLKQGELNSTQRLKLAEKLAKKGRHDKAQTLYKENLNLNGSNDRAKFNYGVSLLESGEAKKGIEILSELQNSEKLSKEERSLVRKNILRAIKNQKQKQKKKSGQNKKSKKNQGKSKGKKSQGQGESEKEQKKESQDSRSKKKEKENKKDQGKRKKSKSEDEQNKNKKKKKLVNKKPKTLEEKIEDIKKKRKMKKVPGLIKQIMDDDRKLQKRYIDTSTEKRQINKKDW